MSLLKNVWPGTGRGRLDFLERLGCSLKTLNRQDRLLSYLFRWGWVLATVYQ